MCPAQLGAVWRREAPFRTTDTRLCHPATVGYHCDLSRAAGEVGGAAAAATMSPCFMGRAMAANPAAEEGGGGRRGFLPVTPDSDATVYLATEVLPTLELGLERLLGAIKYSVPLEVRQTYEGGAYGSRAVERVSHPEHAVGFDPIAWLADYLHKFNPKRPPSFDRASAALKIQREWKRFQAREQLRLMQEEANRNLEAIKLEKRREQSAIKIQAMWRGNCLRQSLQLGRTQDFNLG